MFDAGVGVEGSVKTWRRKRLLYRIHADQIVSLTE